MKSFKRFTMKLPLDSAYHESLEVQPGKPFNYIRNTVSSKKYTKHLQDDPYKQKIEPHGRYMQHTSDKVDPKITNFEHGEITFKNPLYIHWGSGGYKDADSWKNVLHSHYKVTGKSLSKAIRKDGYDAVVTVGHHPSAPHHTSEIVDLTDDTWNKYYGNKK
tara:strand:- start:13531 stop:14013 length:483 start_codon:yes stop_codon:yes gene_type:complete